MAWSRTHPATRPSTKLQEGRLGFSRKSYNPTLGGTRVQSFRPRLRLAIVETVLARLTQCLLSWIIWLQKPSTRVGGLNSRGEVPGLKRFPAAQDWPFPASYQRE
jgi:hypothetical protein